MEKLIKLTPCRLGALHIFEALQNIWWWTCQLNLMKVFLEPRHVEWQHGYVDGQVFDGVCFWCALESIVDVNAVQGHAHSISKRNHEVEEADKTAQ